MRLVLACSLPLMFLAGCASVPSGPETVAFPGTGRSIDDFRGDDSLCRQFAFEQIGGVGRERSTSNAAVGSAVVGAAIGALAGAAIDGSKGAGVGAGAGLIVGSLAGAESSGYAYRSSQYQYDQYYLQCMYSKGHRVPSSNSYTASPVRRTIPPPPPPGTPPPPPPGMPPPPPGVPAR